MTDFYPNSPSWLLRWKQVGVRIYRDDIFEEMDSPGWHERHRLGPVHIDIRCRLCKKIIKTDLKEYGWVEDDSYYDKHLKPHYEEHLRNDPLYNPPPPPKPPEDDFSI